MPTSLIVPQSDINRTIGSPLNFPAAPGVGALGRAAGLTASIASGTTALTVSGIALTSDHEGKMVLLEKAGGVGSGAVVWTTNTTASNATIELTSGTASAGDVGKRITINLAGPDSTTDLAVITSFIDSTHVTIDPAPGSTLAGAHTVVGDDDPYSLLTTIASVTDATHCVLADAAGNSVTGTACVIGVEETDAVMLAALSLGHLFVPDDKAFIVRGPINISNRKLRIWGGGRLYFIDDGIVATNCQISITDTTLDGTFLPYTKQPLRYLDTNDSGQLDCTKAEFIAPKREANHQPTDEAQYWEGVAVFARGTMSSPAARINFLGCKIASGQNGIVLDYCTDFTVTGCEFRTQATKALAHLICFSCTHYVVTANRFKAATGQIANAVYNRWSTFQGDNTVSAQFATISNNNIAGHFDYEAILFFSPQNCSASLNIIQYTETYPNSTGIAVFNLYAAIDSFVISLSTNTITMPDTTTENAAGVYGINISVLNTDYAIGRVSVLGNIIVTPGHGIVGSRIDELKLGDNDITVTGGAAGKDGCLLVNCTGVKVLSGTIRGASAHGINMHCQEFEIAHITASGCAANGIFLFSGFGRDSYIYECNLFGNAGYGFACQSTEPNLHVERNRYRDNVLGPYLGYSATDSLAGNYENDWRTNNRVGIGTVPQAPTHIYSPTGHVWMRAEGNDFHEVSLEVSGAGGAATASILSGKASRGTISAKTASAAGDEMIRVEGRGYDGAAYRLASMIQQVINGAVSAGVVPGRIDFSIADLLGAMKRVLRMDDTVSFLLGETNNCRIVWGTSFPVADVGSILLHTNGAGSTSLYSKAANSGFSSGWQAVLTVNSAFGVGPVRFSGTELYNPTALELRTDANVYSKAEVDALVVDPSDYYTKGQIDTMMAGKANVSHSHTFTGSALPTHTHTETGTTTGATSGGTPAGTVT